jgi:peroxin-5
VHHCLCGRIVGFGGAWASEFDQFSVGHHAGPSLLAAEDTATLDRIFEEAKSSIALEKNQDPIESKASEWVNEFGGGYQKDIAETAGDLLQHIDRDDSRFANSDFVQFMDKLKSRELEIDGDQVVNTAYPAGAGTWASEFNERADDYVESMWANEFGPQMGTERSWAEEFDIPNLNLEDQAVDWVQDWEKNVSDNVTQNMRNEAAVIYSHYRFVEENPFMDKSLEELNQLLRQEMPLSESILALEAKVTMDPKDAQGWTQLGSFLISIEWISIIFVWSFKGAP